MKQSGDFEPGNSIRYGAPYQTDSYGLPERGLDNA